MEEVVDQDRPGFFGRISGWFSRDRDLEEDYEEAAGVRPHALTPSYRYTVTVRKNVATMDDALAAANGLKRGEQQVLNLCSADPVIRQKIVDFMSGVNFAEEGTWEELGENIYMLAPASAYVEVAPATPRMASMRN
jgi:cell division inhibitor SepF